jgi:quercetin dioxygenase-like cupin family protein
MDLPEYYRPMRRIVTGLDAGGHSCVVVDSQANESDVSADHVLDDLWSTRFPPQVAGLTALPNRPGSSIAAGTIVWRRSTMPAGRGSAFHSTRTVDCLTVLSGRVTLLLETGEIELTAGDFVVQRNTLHGWRNDGPEPCILVGAMVSIDSSPESAQDE